MDAEQIHDAAQVIAGMRPRQYERSRTVKAGNCIKAGNCARRQIELMQEQKALIEEVKGLLPGKASEADAIAWMDREIPNWRLGPAPRGRQVALEVTDAD